MSAFAAAGLPLREAPTARAKWGTASMKAHRFGRG
jgi:hypothetical protein